MEIFEGDIEEVLEAGNLGTGDKVLIYYDDLADLYDTANKPDCDCPACTDEEPEEPEIKIDRDDFITGLTILWAIGWAGLSLIHHLWTGKPFDWDIVCVAMICFWCGTCFGGD